MTAKLEIHKIIVALLLGLAIVSPAWASRSFFVDTKAFYPEKLSETTETLSNLMVKKCTSNGFVIIFKKLTMMTRGILSTNLTLLDPLCNATDNSTHLILHSDFTSCATQVKMSENIQQNGQANLTNKVIVYPYILNGQSTSEEQPVEIPVLCQYKVSRETNTPPPTVNKPKPTTTTIQLREDDFTLRLYESEEFNSVVPDLSDVKRSDSLFVQIASHRPEVGGAKFKDCYLTSEEETNPNILSRDYLIESGCTIGRGSQYLLIDDRTSFVFKVPKRKHERPIRLVCDIEPCSQYAERGLTRCMSNADYCKHNKNSGSQMLTVTSSTSFYVVRRHTKLPEVVCPEVSTPLCYCPTETTALSQTNESNLISSPGVSIEYAIVIAAASFMIGVLFMVALWCVHRRTDPSRRKNRATGISESDIDSQNSTTPIRLLSSNEDSRRST